MTTIFVALFWSRFECILFKGLMCSSFWRWSPLRFCFRVILWTGCGPIILWFLQDPVDGFLFWLFSSHLQNIQFYAKLKAALKRRRAKRCKNFTMTCLPLIFQSHSFSLSSLWPLTKFWKLRTCTYMKNELLENMQRLNGAKCIMRIEFAWSHSQQWTE